MTFLLPKILPALLLATGAIACRNEDHTVVSAVAETTEGLTPAFEAFKMILGGQNNGSGPASNDGFRSVNWDAPSTSGPQLPFDMPGDFFAATVTRGLVINSDTDDFRVSNPDDGDPAGPDNRFDSINEKASKDFTTFSDPRLFTPIGTNEIELTFEPAQERHVPAAVSGFAAVFVDVNKPSITSMTAYDAHGCKVFHQDVEPLKEGLSFLGVAFPGKSIIAKVVLTLGEKPIDGYRGKRQMRGGKKGKGGYSGGKKGKGGNRREDIVVLDDFLYGEPQSLLQW